jgi:dipeptidyl aminopeptidase/acylaminoacyl peptidase
MERRGVSAELCVTGRDLTEPRISPDGRWLSVVVAGRPAVLNALRIARDDQGQIELGRERPVTTIPAPVAGRALGGGCHHWLADSSGVVYAAVDGSIWLQSLSPDPPVRILAAPAGGALRGPMVVSDDEGHSIAVAVADEASVWAVELDHGSGGPARVIGEPIRLDQAEDDFCLDAWVRSVGSGCFEIRWQAWSVPDMAWDRSLTRVCTLDAGRVVGRSTISGSGAIQQPRSLTDGTAVAVRDDTGWLNVWVAGSAVVDEHIEHAGPTWGPGQRSYAVEPCGDRVAFVRNEDGFGRLVVAPIGGPADRSTPERPQVVARGVHGQLDWQAGMLSAVRSGARTPTQVVLYDTARDPWTRIVALESAPVAWERIELPEPELIEVGTPTVFARRYVAGQGRMICLVHGGPTDQWQVTFMPRITFWWSRGFDVVVVDPRGSTGHGRSHQQALRGAWGRIDVEDTATVIEAVHGARWATPDTTLVAGSSAGGLTVLGLLVRFGALVAGGIASAPVSDLAGLADTDHRFEAHYTVSLVGPPGAPGYRDNSPRYHLDRIDKPLLVVHGEQDPVVPVEHSRTLVAELVGRGVDVEYHEFAGEGHGLRDPANRRDELLIMERFAERILSPSCHS